MQVCLYFNVFAIPLMQCARTERALPAHLKQACHHAPATNASELTINKPFIFLTSVSDPQVNTSTSIVDNSGNDYFPVPLSARSPECFHCPYSRDSGLDLISGALQNHFSILKSYHFYFDKSRIICE